MTQLGVLDQQLGSAQIVDQAADSLSGLHVRGLSIPELKDLSARVGRLKARADSLLVRITGEIAASGTTASPEKVLQETTKMSKRDARRMSKTAEGLKGMPNVTGLLDSGEINLEQAATLADTAQRTGTAAVDNNAELLQRAGDAPADLFAHEARRFADQHSEDRGEAEFKRQRRKRRLSLFTDDESGMGRLSGWLDPVSFGLVREAIAGHADTLKRRDRAEADNRTAADRAGTNTRAGAGNRSGTSTGDLRRTGPQLRADALVELTTGRDALAFMPLEDRSTTDLAQTANAGTTDSGTTAGAGAKGRTADKRAGETRPETHLIVVADIGLIDGTDPAGRCEIPGTGPVPPSILELLSPDTKLAGMIFSGNGTPLWLGRSRRGVSVGQRLAIAVRDRGCVRCGAPMHSCEIHHKRPWEQGGPTDIDNLEALCREHHRLEHGPHDDHERPASSPDRRRESADRAPDGGSSAPPCGSSRSRDGP